MINETIYKRLYKLLPDLDHISEYRGLTAEGFMKLGVDILHKDDERIVLALSHYYKHPSGDMIPDPDMTLQVLRGAETAEALSYQDMYRYDVVYPDSDAIAGVFNTVNLEAKKSLNSFLAQWLLNLLNQGHK